MCDNYLHPFTAHTNELDQYDIVTIYIILFISLFFINSPSVKQVNLKTKNTTIIQIAYHHLEAKHDIRQIFSPQSDSQA